MNPYSRNGTIMLIGVVIVLVAVAYHSLAPAGWVRLW